MSDACTYLVARATVPVFRAICNSVRAPTGADVQPTMPIAVEVKVLHERYNDDGGGGGGGGKGLDTEPQNGAKKSTSGGQEAVEKTKEKKTKKKKPLQPVPPVEATKCVAKARSPAVKAKKQVRDARVNVPGNQQCSHYFTADDNEAPAGEPPCEPASTNSFEDSVQFRTALWVAATAGACTATTETAASPSSAAAAAATDPALSFWDIGAETMSMSQRSKHTRTALLSFFCGPYEIICDVGIEDR